MTLLGFILGSEPLAQAWRRRHLNPLVERFRPARIPGTRRLAWIVMTILPWLATAHVAADLIRTGMNLNGNTIASTAFAGTWFAWVAIYGLLLPPVGFLLFRGRTLSEEELEEISLTPLAREDLVVGVLHAPMLILARQVVVPILLLPAQSFFTIWHASFIAGDSHAAWRSLSSAFDLSASGMWLIAVGAAFSGGMTCAWRRFHPLLIVLWPIGALVLVAVGVVTYYLATTWIALWFPGIGGNWNYQDGGPIEVHLLGRLFIGLIMGAILLVVSRVFLGAATDQLWRPTEESHAQSALAYGRERAALSNAATRASLQAGALDIIQRHPAAMAAATRFIAALLSGALAGAIFRSQRHAPAWPSQERNLLQLAANLAECLASGGLLIVVALPLAVVLWCRRVASSPTPRPLADSPFPITAAAFLLASFTQLVWLEFAIVIAVVMIQVLLLHHSLVAVVPDAMMCLALALMLSLPAMLSIFGARSPRSTSLAWFCALASIWVLEAASFAGADRSLMFHRDLTQEAGYRFVLLPLLLCWLFADVMPRAANRIRHLGPHYDPESAPISSR